MLNTGNKDEISLTGNKIKLINEDTKDLMEFY